MTHDVAPSPIRALAKELPRHAHMDDLLAISDDPAPRKTRQIEWIGERSILDDPLVGFNLAMGLYTSQQEKAIRRLAARAKTRIVRSRLMEKDHQYAMASFKHLHNTYHFKKDTDFICDVEFRDVDVILGSDVGHEFRDVTDLPRPLPPAFPPFPVKTVDVVFSSESYDSTKAPARGARVQI